MRTSYLKIKEQLLMMVDEQFPLRRKNLRNFDERSEQSNKSSLDVNVKHGTPIKCQV